MAVALKHTPAKATLGRKVSKTMKHGMSGGAARKLNGISDAGDAALVNAVVKAAAAHLAK